MLFNQQVTTHWEDIPDLKAQFPQLDVIEQVRWVDQGNIVTSAGISAGIDEAMRMLAHAYLWHLGSDINNPEEVIKSGCRVITI